MSGPQFGQKEPGRDYPDRPGAFAIVEHDGRIALVRVTFEDGGGRTDLPGGGLEEGESPEQAAIRECGEEAGIAIAVEAEVAHADHYFVNEKGVSRNTRGVFFSARMVREAASLKIEADHQLIWREPHRALVELDRDAHAWALVCWLRRDRA